MSEKHLHIITFEMPFPANYGGLIDVFYRIKAIHELGVKIHLHVFTSKVHKLPNELEEICNQIHVYTRKTGIKSQLSCKPYIVKSRESDDLLKNLSLNDDPILYEGMHTTHLLNHRKLKNRLKIVRTCNIEHQYYWSLFNASGKPLEMIYFLFESIRLKCYQRRLKHANYILPISEKDQSYFNIHFPVQQISWVPAFYSDTGTDILPGHGNYALYHGNLSVAENIKAARFLIKKVFSKIDYSLIIAGLDPDKSLIKLAAKYPNVQLIDSPNDIEIKQLIQQAQFNILFTFQSTGFKLKLLYALQYGRFCIANSTMTEGTKLDALCLKAETANEIASFINKYRVSEIPNQQLEGRRLLFSTVYSNKINARKIIKLLS